MKYLTVSLTPEFILKWDVLNTIQISQKQGRICCPHIQYSLYVLNGTTCTPRVFLNLLEVHSNEVHIARAAWQMQWLGYRFHYKNDCTFHCQSEWLSAV